MVEEFTSIFETSQLCITVYALPSFEIISEGVLHDGLT